MVLQGCKSTPQKSRAIESGHGRHAVQVANVCSYKLGLKNLSILVQTRLVFAWTVTYKICLLPDHAVILTIAYARLYIATYIAIAI